MKIEGILVDFDGVISRNSAMLTFKFLYGFLCDIYKIPLSTVLSYYKIVLNFPLKESIDLFFDSFGLENRKNEFMKLHHNLIDLQGESVGIEKDFMDFVDFCSENDIALKVVTMLKKESDKRLSYISSIIDKCNIISIDDYGGKSSKASPFVYGKILDQNKSDRHKTWMCVDDSPIALRSAYENDIITVMMMNDIFTVVDYRLYKKYINYRVDSFVKLIRILMKERKKHK